MGFLLFPWQLMAFCPSHYEVHEEHHGNCADGMMENDGHNTTANEGPILSMPDECYFVFYCNLRLSAKPNPYQSK